MPGSLGPEFPVEQQAPWFSGGRLGKSNHKMLLIGLTLTTSYTLVVLMTMFWPAVCRRSSASWTLVATMVSLGLWLATPFFGRLAAGHAVLEGLFGRWQEVVAFFPHPIYFTWLVSLATFFLVTLLDKRRITVDVS